LQGKRISSPIDAVISILAHGRSRLADAHAQQDPTFGSTIAYTRLTTKAAVQALRQAGVEDALLPSENGMGLILNRLGYRLRKVVKAKPKKTA